MAIKTSRSYSLGATDALLGSVSSTFQHISEGDKKHALILLETGSVFERINENAEKDSSYKAVAITFCWKFPQKTLKRKRPSTTGSANNLVGVTTAHFTVLFRLFIEVGPDSLVGLNIENFERLTQGLSTLNQSGSTTLYVRGLTNPVIGPIISVLSRRHIGKHAGLSQSSSISQ